MNIYSKRVCLCLVFIILSCSTSFSETLNVGASFAPPYYTVQDKQVTGIFGELMSQVLSEAGFDVIWKPYPTKRVYINLINGRLDVYLGPLKPEFKEFQTSVIHSRFSPVSIELRCFYFGEKSEITKREELSGKSILLIRGYTYGGLINFIHDPENNIHYSETRSFGQAVAMLKSKRADYHLDYRKTGEVYLKNTPEPDLKYSTFAHVDLYFIVSKHTPNAETVLTRIENAFRKIYKKN